MNFHGGIRTHEITPSFIYQFVTGCIRPLCHATYSLVIAQLLGVEPKAFCSTFAAKLLAKAGGIALTATGATRNPLFSCTCQGRWIRTTIRALCETHYRLFPIIHTQSNIQRNPLVDRGGFPLSYSLFKCNYLPRPL